MKRQEYRFVVFMDGLGARIEHVPVERLLRLEETPEHFKTFTAAKQWLEARWRADVDHLRTNITALKRLRRTHVAKR